MSELSDVKGEPMKKGVDHASKTHKSGRNDEDPLGCATTGQLISTVENFNSYLENRAEDTMRFPCSSVVEEVDLRTATQDSATDMDKRCGYHLLPHQQRVADEHGLLHDAGKSKSALRAARILAKAGVVLVSLASTHVMRNYALSQAASSPANAKRWWRWIGDSDKYALKEPDWLAEPHSLLLLAAWTALSISWTYYHQLNRGDKFQDCIEPEAFLASLILGLLPGRKFLAAMLTVMPWGVCLDLIASDAFHAGMKRRGVYKERSRCSGDVEKQ